MTSLEHGADQDSGQAKRTQRVVETTKRRSHGSSREDPKATNASCARSHREESSSSSMPSEQRRARRRMTSTQKTTHAVAASMAAAAAASLATPPGALAVQVRAPSTTFKEEASPAGTHSVGSRERWRTSARPTSSISSDQVAEAQRQSRRQQPLPDRLVHRARRELPMPALDATSLPNFARDPCTHAHEQAQG